MIPLWLLQLDRHPPVLLSSLKLFTSKTKSHNLRLDYEHRSLSNAYKGLNLGATLSSISNGPHAGHPRSKWWLTMSPLSLSLLFSISLSLSLPMAHSCNTFERRVSVNWHVATIFIVKLPILLALLTQNCPKVVPKLSQNYLQVVLKLSQSCPKTVSGSLPSSRGREAGLGMVRGKGEVGRQDKGGRGIGMGGYRGGRGLWSVEGAAGY